MELRHLRYFVAVADEGSFTRAAARLGMQQPPLSQQVKALEKELGVELLRRHARGVDVTAAGEALLAEAKTTLGALEAASERARRIASGTVGTLRIGLATSAATHPAAPRTIAAFRDRHSGVHLAFTDGNAASLTEALQEGKLDVALIRSPVARPPELAFQTLLEEPLRVAILKSHRLALQARRRKSDSIALSALRDEGFILVRRSGAPGIYGDLILACRNAGFEPRIASEVGNMLIGTMLAAAGVGVTVVPASMRESHGERVTYLRLTGASRVNAPLTLARHAANLNPAITSFRALAKEIAKELAVELRQ
jgi:DNA-binding transcriptional LysR family regulator